MNEPNEEMVSRARGRMTTPQPQDTHRMAKRLRPAVHRPAQAVQAIDLGPSLSRDAKGRVRRWGGAADVVIETRTDPDHPNRAPIRAARRRDALSDLLARGSINKRQADAGNRFLDDLCVAAGSSQAGFLGLPGAGVRRDTLPEKQVRAITRVHAVRNRMGLNDRTVFWWVVMDNRGVREWEDRFGQRGQGMAMLGDALDDLDDFYNRS